MCTPTGIYLQSILLKLHISVILYLHICHQNVSGGNNRATESREGESSFLLLVASHSFLAGKYNRFKGPQVSGK